VGQSWRGGVGWPGAVEPGQSSGLAGASWKARAWLAEADAVVAWPGARGRSDAGAVKGLALGGSRQMQGPAGKPALAGLGPALAGVPALAGLRSGFSRFGIFREILRELFVNLGGNWEGKSSILREIRGIGARKFVAM
jgi:hypothetical protein